MLQMYPAQPDRMLCLTLDAADPSTVASSLSAQGQFLGEQERLYNEVVIQVHKLSTSRTQLATQLPTTMPNTATHYHAEHSA